ncbi:MAG: hypothetical protein ABR600_12930 [Actinomycetota bacterium]
MAETVTADVAAGARALMPATAVPTRDATNSIDAIADRRMG